MSLTINPLEALDTVFTTVGVIVLLKRVADMDGYHRIRVVVLTVTLSVFAFLLFDRLGVRLDNSNCVVEFNDPRPDM